MERAQRYKEVAKSLKEAIDRHGWDGGWYRRAYFDDGTPLGSEQNQECQIDAISQSWSVISGAADPNRAKIAMDSLERHLVRREEGLIQLLSPPFDRSHLEPGYIKGYVPGQGEWWPIYPWRNLVHYGQGNTGGRGQGLGIFQYDQPH